jgi:hypothetical protein
MQAHLLASLQENLPAEGFQMAPLLARCAVILLMTHAGPQSLAQRSLTQAKRKRLKLVGISFLKPRGYLEDLGCAQLGRFINLDL